MKKKKKDEAEDIEKRIAALNIANKQLRNLEDSYRRVLTKSGKYTSDMMRQVEITASTTMILRKIRDEIFANNEPPVIEEKSREGAMRKRENPIYTVYAKFSDMLRRDLRALDMNKELSKGRDDTVGGGEDDAVATMMKKMSEEDGEDED